MLAHIFTVTSGDYLQSLSRSIGYHGELPTSRSKTAFILSGSTSVRRVTRKMASLSQTTMSRSSRISYLRTPPRFSLERGNLEVSEHSTTGSPCLQHPTSRRRVSWFWTNEEVTAAWDSKNPVNLSDAVESEPDPGPARIQARIVMF
ncbi:hypothetical protein BJV77DRAFT_389041 [Russula vinacea]|nr:hypothetical protein BJV77DRAFT_389041 [Russula vinacea]